MCRCGVSRGCGRGCVAAGPPSPGAGPAAGRPGLACGSGASSKFVRDAGDKRFERVENVKNVHEYIDRIDEMISRKLDYIAEHGIR